MIIAKKETRLLMVVMFVVIQEYKFNIISLWKHQLNATICMNCKCRKSENVSAITHPWYPYYKQLHFHTHVHKGCLHTLACMHPQTTHVHFSHIHTPSAQQVWHFAPNVIFQPISSVIALLIFKPTQCLTGLGVEMDAELSSHWESTCSFQPTHDTKAACSSFSVSPSDSVVCGLTILQCDLLFLSLNGNGKWWLFLDILAWCDFWWIAMEKHFSNKQWHCKIPYRQPWHVQQYDLRLHIYVSIVVVLPLEHGHVHTNYEIKPTSVYF